MSKRPLVSVITPCYNGETYVHRYFESILAQTYPRIEVYFVNDGSTDRTEEIALRYKEKLEARGISMTYIYQENAGQAAAINRALPLFQGEYLTWPDSDDWMSPDCIEKKVRYLEEHPEKGFVLCKSAVVSEDQLDRAAWFLQRNDVSSGRVFDDLIFENDIYFAPGGYMVRSEAMLNAIPQRRIYECKTGQNWQLLLPVAYRYECGFLDDVLYYYLVRRNSHSRAEVTYQDQVAKTYRHQDTLDHVVGEIEMPEEERRTYLHGIKVKYIRKRLHLAAQFHRPEAAKEEYESLLRENEAAPQDRKTYLRGRYRILDILCKFASLPGRAVRKLIRIIRGKSP